MSYELLKRGVDIFFSEMDVWWIKSPKPSLIEFQKQEGPHDNHLFLSGHQNNPNAPNIGVYAAKSNDQTKEYFEICIDLLKQKPDTHDQLVMAEVHRLYMETAFGRTKKSFGFEKMWNPGQSPPPVPTLKHPPFSSRMWSPHEVIADERPIPTTETLAIHTLCGMPLLKPHGKKMIAKELGAWYGFQSNPLSPQQNYYENNAAVPSSGGYYTRTGNDSGSSYRRYIWLDGPIRTNAYSTSINNRYHNAQVFEWTMSILIAIARYTDRILILPPMIDATMDAGA